MLQIVVTGDESWCFQFNSEMKQQSMEWHVTNSPQQKEVKFQQSHVKTMLIFFFLCCQKYPPEVCSWRHQGIQSLLFRSDETFVHAYALCQKQAVKKQPLAAVTWQHAYTLCAKCEAVSCFHIDLCDLTSPLLARFGTDNLFFLPESESAPKRRAFQWQ
jgi:hypothetical protein